MSEKGENIGCFPVFLVCGVLFAIISDDGGNKTYSHHGVFLTCATNVDQDSHCDRITGIGSEFVVTVNPASQVVQLKITVNREEWISKYIYLENCKVLDGDNWTCYSGNRYNPDSIIDQETMNDGELYHSVTGGGTDIGDSYNSSLIGMRYYIYKYLNISPVTSAQDTHN
jgi:hypothetical protein